MPTPFAIFSQLGKNPLEDLPAFIEILDPDALVVQVGVVAGLAHGEHGGGGVELVLEEADGRDRAALADQQRLTRQIRRRETPCGLERRGAPLRWPGWCLWRGVLGWWFCRCGGCRGVGCGCGCGRHGKGTLRGCASSRGVPDVDNGRLERRVDLALGVSEPRVGFGADVDVDGVGALQQGELGLEVRFEAVGDLLGRLRRHDPDGQRRLRGPADRHRRLALGHFDPVHRQVRIAPALHQRQRERLLVLDLRMAREQRRGDGCVCLGLAVRELVDRVVEVGDGDLCARRANQCRQQHRQVFQRLVLH